MGEVQQWQGDLVFCPSEGDYWVLLFVYIYFVIGTMLLLSVYVLIFLFMIFSHAKICLYFLQC